MNSYSCAPKKYDPINDTCYNDNQIMQLCVAYNKYIARKKLSGTEKTKGGVIDAELITIKGNKTDLLNQIRTKFNHICGNDDYCLTQQEFINDLIKDTYDDIKENTFRSVGPNGEVEWLSTGDIDYILNQYHSVYPDFKYIGTVPRDCNKYKECPLYKIDYRSYFNKGIKRMGTVFNLDAYGESGSHWVAMFIDMDKGEINFCDSTGAEPQGEIKETIDHFKNFYQQKFSKQPIYKENKISYQKDNSECGIYSSNFIIRRLAGESFEDVTGNHMNFKEINSCRNVYFINKPVKKTTPDKRCDPTI